MGDHGYSSSLASNGSGSRSDSRSVAVVSLEVGEDHVDVAAVLPQELAAGPAGRRRVLGVGDDDDAREDVVAVGEGFDERDAFGAKGQAVGRVLDVAARDDVAVARLERRAHLEAGVAGVRPRAGERGGGDERLGQIGLGRDRDFERDGLPRRVVAAIPAGAALEPAHRARRSHLEIVGAGAPRRAALALDPALALTAALDRRPDRLRAAFVRVAQRCPPEAR